MHRRPKAATSLPACRSPAREGEPRGASESAIPRARRGRAGPLLPASASSGSGVHERGFAFAVVRRSGAAGRGRSSRPVGLSNKGLEGVRSSFASQARTIVAGLALSFTPEAVVGKNVIVVANLAPREFNSAEFDSSPDGTPPPSARHRGARPKSFLVRHRLGRPTRSRSTNLRDASHATTSSTDASSRCRAIESRSECRRPSVLSRRAINVR